MSGYRNRSRHVRMGLYTLALQPLVLSLNNTVIS